jgi:hypothetical protein
MKTQTQMYYEAESRSGQLNELFMDMVREGDMTQEDLDALIVKRPHVYGRFSGLRDKLPRRPVATLVQ